MGDVMRDKVYKGIKQGRTTRGVLLLLAIGACVTLLASECSRSHVQETVTVAPRAAATQAQAQATNATTATKSAPPALDAETEAAGDALAHAIVALKARHRDEALYYMNLGRTRLTRELNPADANANSNSTREHLSNDLRELDAAERSARHNAYDQSRAQLLSISNDLDHLH
jgi:hypothetical protein